MQVTLIQKYFGLYTAYLKSRRADQNLYIWESQYLFQENWDLDASDLMSMYDQSLQNSQTRRLWNRESYAPKQMMLAFASLQPHFFRQMFTDLFDEDKMIEGRLGRFLFYCEEMFNAYIEENPKTKESTHYHDDGYEIISLYLAFRYPMQYTPYRLEMFQHFLKKVNTKNIPPTHDMERYFKICRTLYKLMQKEEALMNAHRKRLKANYHEESLLLVYDFISFVHHQ